MLSSCTKVTNYLSAMVWRPLLCTAILILSLQYTRLSEAKDLGLYKDILIVGQDSAKISEEINSFFNEKNVHTHNARGVSNIYDYANKTIIYYSSHYPPPNIFENNPDLALKTEEYDDEIHRRMVNPYKFKYSDPSCSSLFFYDSRNMRYFFIVSDARNDRFGCRYKFYNSLLSAR